MSSSFKVEQKKLALNEVNSNGPILDYEARTKIQNEKAANVTKEETQHIHKIREIINNFPLEKEQEGYDRLLV